MNMRNYSVDRLRELFTDIKRALENSTPIMSHYPEPVKFHKEMLAKVKLELIILENCKK